MDLALNIKLRLARDLLLGSDIIIDKSLSSSDTHNLQDFKEDEVTRSSDKDGTESDIIAKKCVITLGELRRKAWNVVSQKLRAAAYRDEVSF